MKTYQNIEINNTDIGGLPTAKNSAFYNEGKWNNFISPLLPIDCKDQTFVELGCNAGLFLRLAKEKGFRNVVGFDKSRRTVKKAIQYRDSLKLDYKIINKKISADFDCDEIPVADIILLSNVHYHLQIADFIYLKKF